jgi:hypothetical protein
MPSSPRLAPFLRPRARTLAALALLAGALSGAPSASRAFAGDDTPSGGAPAAGAPATPRLAALEQEIRHLERSLQAMRRSRVELTAGRPEPVAVDAPARAACDARRAALREVARYEGARARALAAHAEAVSAKDDAKVVAARSALDAADNAFVAAVQKIDARAEAQASAPDSPNPQKAETPKPDATPHARPPAAGGDGRSPGRRGARRGGDGSSMGSGGGSGDDADDADDVDDED